MGASAARKIKTEHNDSPTDDKTARALGDDVLRLFRGMQSSPLIKDDTDSECETTDATRDDVGSANQENSPAAFSGSKASPQLAPRVNSDNFQGAGGMMAKNRSERSRKARLRRRASFGALGLWDRASLPNDVDRFLHFAGLSVRVIEPPTPARRSVTEEDVSKFDGGFFDFDKLDREWSDIDEKQEDNDAGEAPGDSSSPSFEPHGAGQLNTAARNRNRPWAMCTRLNDESPTKKNEQFNRSCDFVRLSPMDCSSRQKSSDITCASPSEPNAHSRRHQTDGSAQRVCSAPASERSSGMRIALIVNGSRGDVQPLVALALRLGQLRHQTLIFTNADLVDFCVSRGVEAVPVFASCRSVMESMGGMPPSKGSDIVPVLRKGSKVAAAWLKENSGACRAVDDSLEEFAPDAVICGTQATGPAMRLELGVGVPSIYVFLSRDALEFGISLTELQPFRPSFFAVSTVLDSMGATCESENIVQTGAWVLEEQPAPSDLCAQGKLGSLKAFLCCGTTPVAIGWGSMIPEGISAAAMLGLALRALQIAGKRGVILGGWAQLDSLGADLVRRGFLTGLFGSGSALGGAKEQAKLAHFASTQVCFLSDVPHQWLFPQCSCVVHHGGAGTTHAALHAGAPSVVTPIFADQFSNALTVELLKVGVGFTQCLADTSPHQIAEAILQAEATAPKVTQISKGLHDEARQGVREAAAVIDKFIREKVRTGAWSEEVSCVRGGLKPNPGNCSQASLPPRRTSCALQPSSPHVTNFNRPSNRCLPKRC